ncbi:MAG TPA: DUF5916 domain-containing protein [Bacteroidales bacterium]|nr:DUF5916 domain-containing protein [Bacteroidales bacterium]
MDYSKSGPYFIKVAAIIGILFFTFSGRAAAQERQGIDLQKKIINAVRADAAPRIDGVPDDEIWQKGALATDFIMYNPYNGISSKYRTEVRILYDDDALYIGAMMFDSAPDSIFTELGPRDADNLNADNFWIEISPFNDGLYGEQFKVYASNVQADIKLNSGEDDYHREDTWDAVWESATGITAEGWYAEIRIPYSALRFPKSENQTWGINFFREVRRTRETSSWSFVTKEYGSSVAHMGGLTGITNVTPPLRLSLIPYVSGYIENISDQSGLGTSYNGGLDIKVGLSESFTLDATLIPDFGQVQSDDRILNLTPYEVKYNEKRPFFMEGTELFNKGDIFYSRRIGGTPHLYEDVYNYLGPDETITRHPSEVQLINATKISGRTKNGLGVGIFNAVTGPVWAEVTNTLTDETRKIRIEPMTNYNMVVLDQSMKNNSYLSFANTSVIRAGEKDEYFYTANVSNLQTLLQTNNKLYSVSGSATLSQKYFTGADADLGHSLEFNIGKTGGAFRADYNFSLMSDRYDPNDMGYLQSNNEFGHSLDFSYNTYKPFGNIMSTRNSIETRYNQLFIPRAYTSANIELGSMFILMNYWSLSLDAEITPWGEDDYFEPRREDMSIFYHRPAALMLGFRGDTDRSKKFYIEALVEYFNSWSDYDQRGFGFSLQPEYKASRRFSFGYSLDYSKHQNDIGYVDRIVLNDDIVFGKRDVTTITNTLSGAFIFTADSYLTLRGRYYWSRAEYDGDYFLLRNDGSLQDVPYFGASDVNSNFLNIDMVYTWRFAPGSELSLVWKNSIASSGSLIVNNAFDNLQDLLQMPQTNSISLKILYYLDYQNFKKVLSHK